MGLTLNEVWRRLQNVIATGKVVATQAKEGIALVKVAYDDDTKSDWLPVMSKDNSLLKIWMPPLVGEQVTVVRPFGNADGGIVIPSIFNKESREPSGANESNVIVEFEDGASFNYDTKSGELNVTSISKITLKVPDVVLNCENLEVTGDAKFKGSVDIAEALQVGGDISNDGSITTAGEVTDMMGSLTNFKTSDNAVRA